jgi:DNA ligase-1
MAKREKVMLAHTYKGKGSIAGWYASPKLDGMRAIWLPKTQGMTKEEVKNIPEYSSFVHNTNLDHDSTGLWSRLGNVVHAPNWFIYQLPDDMPLDGELWGGYGMSRQKIMSIAKKYVPIDSEWEQLQYRCYSVPIEGMTTRSQCHKLGKISQNVIVPHIGVELSFNGVMARAQLDALLQVELDKENGEGMIIRAPQAKYEYVRSHSMLKVKGHDDMEVVVMGCTTGRETDKGSRHLGRMGAMIVSDGKNFFKLSGFNDKERELEGFKHMDAMSAFEWARANPETECPEWITPKHFPIGSLITIKYRGMSDDNVPNEARYWRKRGTME